MESLGIDYFEELPHGTVEVYKDSSRASFPREIQFNSCVSGYHMYQDRWLPVQDETLACQREEGNVYDPFAIKVGEIWSYSWARAKKDQLHVFVIFETWRSNHLQDS